MLQYDILSCSSAWAPMHRILTKAHIVLSSVLFSYVARVILYVCLLNVDAIVSPRRPNVTVREMRADSALRRGFALRSHSSLFGFGLPQQQQRRVRSAAQMSATNLWSAYIPGSEKRKAREAEHSKEHRRMEDRRHWLTGSIGHVVYNTNVCTFKLALLLIFTRQHNDIIKCSGAT